MKAVFAIALFALFCAFVNCADVCDPDSDGKPECAAGMSNQPFRNYWDPTAYWVCNGAGEATAARCPSQTLFSDSKSECVVWTDWTWTNPCGY